MVKKSSGEVTQIQKHCLLVLNHDERFNVGFNTGIFSTRSTIYHVYRIVIFLKNVMTITNYDVQLFYHVHF